MKYILAGLFTIVSYFGILVSGIWAIVSFIVYLVKDKPFQWWSIGSIGICTVLLFVSVFIAAYVKAVAEVKRKSKWQQRLEEIREKKK